MKSVVVCGSKRYAAEMAKFCKELEKLGVLVFEPNFKDPQPEDKEFPSPHLKHIVFKGLTLEHFNWIKKSEVCFIFNKDGYAGVSVSMEMAYATALGKPVFALSAETGDPARNALIDKVVKTPQKLASLL
jgi:hypothetical protein